MKYAVVLSNGNPHIVEMNSDGNFVTIGFAAGETNLEAIKQLVNLANKGDTF